MLTLQNLSYFHPDKNLLFRNISISLQQHEKIALIGNNGSGKSTLLRLIAQELKPLGGQIHLSAEHYFVPQILGQFDHLTIGEALRVNDRLNALHEILSGRADESSYHLLQDDWTIEERCQEAREFWQVGHHDLSRKLGLLSGGQKTKVFLAGIRIHQPDLVLLDEPSNHLDLQGRQLLYNYIQSAKSSIILVSHDRKLLQLMGQIAELSSRGITCYGGNFDFYLEQKRIEQQALYLNLQNKEKALDKAREKERETVARKQKSDNRGKAKQEKAGVPRIMMNTLKNNAEKSATKIREVHAEKIMGIREELEELRAEIPDLDKMKFNFGSSAIHKGKLIFEAFGINYTHGRQPLWKTPLSFQIKSGDRIALKGPNGSGKTSLIRIIMNRAEPHPGQVYRTPHHAVYIDQDYSLIQDHLSVYEQVQRFNDGSLQEHELKTRLHRFLFTRQHWDKCCAALSGGERMRLALCCLTTSHQAPDMIILDEPTNNLDLQNIEILTAAIRTYEGALLVVSHDELFLQSILTGKTIELQQIYLAE